MPPPHAWAKRCAGISGFVLSTQMQPRRLACPVHHVVCVKVFCRLQDCDRRFAPPMWKLKSTVLQVTDHLHSIRLLTPSTAHASSIKSHCESEAGGWFGRHDGGGPAAVLCTSDQAGSRVRITKGRWKFQRNQRSSWQGAHNCLDDLVVIHKQSLRPYSTARIRRAPEGACAPCHIVRHQAYFTTARFVICCWFSEVLPSKQLWHRPRGDPGFISCAGRTRQQLHTHELIHVYVHSSPAIPNPLVRPDLFVLQYSSEGHEVGWLWPRLEPACVY